MQLNSAEVCARPSADERETHAKRSQELARLGGAGLVAHASTATATAALSAGNSNTALPSIFVYDCLDELHAELLGRPASADFFTIHHQRNQYLSEVAIHRAMLVLPGRVSAAAHYHLLGASCVASRPSAHACLVWR